MAKASRDEAWTARTLEGIDLFAAASAALRRTYEERCAWQWWDKGATILDRDARSDDVYFVVAGAVTVANYGAAGDREVALDDVEAGGYFGEIAAIDGERRSANVTAQMRTLTARLSGPLFVEYLLNHPPAALAMLRRLTQIVRAASGRILELSTLAAQHRIYGDLLRRARMVRGNANAAVIKPMPRHHQIAARAGTTRETVARVLSDLVRRGVVVRGKDALAIKDVAALMRMAEPFDGERGADAT
jgi:CRP/FNR family cyclic AMP-dependent transcriptional regulator